MFSKAKGKSGRATAAAAPSIVSMDLTIKGDVVSSGEVHVDGVVDGDVRSNALTVGRTGVVNGRIAAKEALIRGSVNGPITADSVTLAASARVIGDIQHESLTIEAGAFLEGHCRRSGASARDESGDRKPSVERAATALNLVVPEAGPGRRGR